MHSQYSVLKCAPLKNFLVWRSSWLVLCSPGDKVPFNLIRLFSILCSTNVTWRESYQGDLLESISLYYNFQNKIHPAVSAKERSVALEILNCTNEQHQKMELLTRVWALLLWSANREEMGTKVAQLFHLPTLPRLSPQGCTPSLYSCQALPRPSCRTLYFALLNLTSFTWVHFLI